MDGKEREILEAARQGDEKRLWELLGEHRPRLKRMIELRLHPRVQGRIDASDVIQESFLEVSQRLETYLESPELPFYVWVRFITAQKLIQLHRRHLGAAKRDAKREVALIGPGMMSSAILASALVDSGLSPSADLMRDESLSLLGVALDELNELDREVLALRHFEQLTNLEVAHVLEIQESAASRRYLRAIRRLKERIDRPG